MTAPDWQTSAACAAADPEAWFPDHNMTADNLRALDICRQTCPVRQECLDAAMDEERGLGRASRFGIRGGLTHIQRAELVRGVQPLAEGEQACRDKRGTYGGYQRHVWHRQKPCDACKAARNTRRREDRAKEKAA